MANSRPSEVDRTFVIADLSGYTALTESHGGMEAAKVVSRFVELAQSALVPGARIIERVGDEILIVADAPIAGARTAIRLLDAIDAEPLFPAVRVSVHAGPVYEDGGRYFGTALNLTARVAGHARSGQILCTEPIAIAVADDPELCCPALATVRLRNVAEPVALFELSASATTHEPSVIDPVCRMRVRLDSAPARLPFAGTTFSFCSFECAKTFAEHPERYVEADDRVG
jgi:class 3 adenylate cyclase